MTYIDAPQLDGFHIAFFNQIDFDGPRLAQFISRTALRDDAMTGHVWNSMIAPPSSDSLTLLS